MPQLSMGISKEANEGQHIVCPQALLPYLLDRCGLKDSRGVADAMNGEGWHAGSDRSARSTTPSLCSDAA